MAESERRGVLIGGFHVKDKKQPSYYKEHHTPQSFQIPPASTQQQFQGPTCSAKYLACQIAWPRQV